MRVSTTLIGVQSIDDGVRGEDPERSAMMTRQQLWTLATVLSVLLLAGPAAAGQASMLDSSEATAFMGSWVITMETPRGTNEQNVTISDQGGKVTARLERGRSRSWEAAASSGSQQGSQHQRKGPTELVCLHV